MKPEVVVATRFFEKDSNKAYESETKLGKFCLAALDAGANHVLVAVNIAEDKSSLTKKLHETSIGSIAGNRGLYLDENTTLQGLGSPTTTFFSVQPWGKFATPLNAILVQGRKYWERGAFLLLASVEVTLSEEAVNTLASHMDNRTLVVGAALLGHEYAPGIHNPASGRQTPWNTLALWNPLLLWNHGGFPLLVDGPLRNPENSGVEEVVTIASIQNRKHCYAKLIEVPGQNWDTSSFTGERLKAHKQKMANKNSRPAAQLLTLGLRGPTVSHD